MYLQVETDNSSIFTIFKIMKINCDQMLRENRCLQCLEGAEIPCWVHKLNLIMMLASKLSDVFKMGFQILNALK